MFGGPVTQKPNTTTSATFQSSVFSEKGGQKAPQGRRNTNKRYSDVLLRNYEAPKKHGFSRRQGEYSYKFSQFTHLQKEPPSTFKANKNQQRKPDHDILFRSEKRNADEMQAPRGLKSLPGPKGQPTILIPKEDYFFDTKPGKRALQPTGVHQNDILLQTYMPDLSPQRGRKHAGKPKDNIDMHFNEGQPRKTLSKSQSAKVIQVNYEQTYAKQAHTNRQAFLEYAKKELKNSEQKDYTSIKFANEDGRNVVDTMSHTAHLKKNRPVSVSEQKYQARKSYAALAKKKKSKKKRSKPVKLTEKVKIHNRRIALNHVNSNNSINVAKIKQRGRDGENRIQARQVSSHGHLF
jgi:hypothetical protein